MHVTNSDSDRDRLERARRSVDLVSGAHEVLEVHRGIHDRRLRLAAANAGASGNEEEGLQAKVERLEAELTALRERFDAIEQAGRYDAMTGTYKREAFVDALRTEWHVHGSNKQSLAVLFLDVDNFKKVNDDDDHRAATPSWQLSGRRPFVACDAPAKSRARYAGDDSCSCRTRTYSKPAKPQSAYGRASTPSRFLSERTRFRRQYRSASRAPILIFLPVAARRLCWRQTGQRTKLSAAVKTVASRIASRTRILVC